jgi:hypothetical protein
MATTTNFGWETPDDTDLVKDGALAMRTLGNSIDTSFVDLKGGTTGQVLSKASNTDLDFTWVAQDDSNAIQNAIVDAKGDLISATAADTPARLAVGTNGHVLTADSSTATGLKWAAAPSGKIIQVVSTTKTDTFSSSTTDAYTDITGMSVTITPTSASSQILVFVDLSAACTYNNTVLGWRLVRGATAIGIGDAANNRNRSTNADIGGDFNGQLTSAMHFLDSPATTSATTYKCQFFVDVGTFYLNRSPNDTDSSVCHRTASSITVMEIGA